MKRLSYAKVNNLSSLHDELLAAMPALRPVLNASGDREAVMGVEGRGANIWLTVPDTADEAAIAAVVAAHDALAPRPPTAQAQAMQTAAAEVTAEIDKAFLARSTATVKVGLNDVEKAAITDKAIKLMTTAEGRA